MQASLLPTQPQSLRVEVVPLEEWVGAVSEALGAQSAACGHAAPIVRTSSLFQADADIPRSMPWSVDMEPSSSAAMAHPSPRALAIHRAWGAQLPWRRGHLARKTLASEFLKPPSQTQSMIIWLGWRRTMTLRLLTADTRTTGHPGPTSPRLTAPPPIGQASSGTPDHKTFSAAWTHLFHPRLPWSLPA